MLVGAQLFRRVILPNSGRDPAYSRFHGPEVTGSVADSVRRADDVPAVRSVDSGQSAASYGSCIDQRGQVTDGLSFPNGVSSYVTVTSGAATSHIQVRWRAGCCAAGAVAQPVLDSCPLGR